MPYFIIQEGRALYREVPRTSAGCWKEFVISANERVIFRYVNLYPETICEFPFTLEFHSLIKPFATNRTLLVRLFVISGSGEICQYCVSRYHISRHLICARVSKVGLKTLRIVCMSKSGARTRFVVWGRLNLFVGWPEAKQDSRHRYTPAHSWEQNAISIFKIDSVGDPGSVITFVIGGLFKNVGSLMLVAGASRALL